MKRIKKEILEEKQNWEEEKDKIYNVNSISDEVIDLDIGGITGVRIGK